MLLTFVECCDDYHCEKTELASQFTCSPLNSRAVMKTLWKTHKDLSANSDMVQLN